MERFTLFFNFGNKMVEYPLYDVEDRHVDIPLQRYGIDGALRLEVWKDNWLLLSDETTLLFINNQRQLGEIAMQDRLVVTAVTQSNKQFSILIRRVGTDLTVFNKYVIQMEQEITVGSSNICTLFFKTNYIASTHFVLHRNIQTGEVILQAAPNQNIFVFINGERVPSDTTPTLSLGDIIIFADIKIMYLGDIIAVNHTDELVSRLPQLFAKDVPDGKEQYLCETKFSRIPRMMEPLDDEKVSIDAPPNGNNDDEMPAIFTLGPSLTMPMPMLISMVWRMTATSGSSMGSSMYVAMFISMLGSAGLGIFWNMMRQNWQKKKKARDDAWRLECYTKYINKNKALLDKKNEHNRNLMLSQYLSCYDLFQPKNKLNLWNRNVHHPDFLTVRLGVGSMALPNEVDIPPEKFTLDDNELMEMPRQMREEYKVLRDVPALVDLARNNIVGLIGQEQNVHAVMRTLITQVAALHAYTDVNIAFFYDENDGVNYEWVRWLPHTFIKDKSLRLVAGNPDDMTNVMAHLQSVLRGRAEATEAQNGGDKSGEVSKGPAKGEPGNYDMPYMIICFMSEKMLDKSALSKYFDPKYSLSTTFILGFNDVSLLPNECNAIIQVDEHYKGFYNLDKTRDETNKIGFEVISEAQADWFARSLMSMNLKEMASAGSIPNYIDFMGILKIGDLNSYPIEKMYLQNRAYESIKAVMGIGEGGKLQILDLHEKKFGPHGLVAGTTGSGKSETLQTIILSWMMSYSPDEVAFVLIDYKGGGMANAFIGSPHVAGTITNISDDDDEDDDSGDTGSDSLDQNQTRRALIAIKSEIKRRQKMFKKQNVNHVDQYMRLYRKGEVSEPLPHLIIISDEFAELKQQQPEFIKELVSAARVGRSLGVHLILATQKPSNSVDDEIWANSRFKICLRVQDKADSNGMLHRPEAAFLTKTGRGYFQLGNDEIFEEFQSAYSGADYIPTDVVESPEDVECRMIELDGTDTYIEREHKEKAEDTQSQLAACVQFITESCEKLGYKTTRQLWAPQLGKKLYLPKVLEFCMQHDVQFTKGLLGVVGLVDDPEMQDQYPLLIDLYNSSNTLIMGQPVSGKTTFIKTLITSLITMYSPDLFQFYVLDFSSRTMKVFKKLPHCGDVLFEDDEGEYIQRLFQLLRGIVEERKQLFSEANVGSITDYLAIKKIPVITLFIDNLYPFKNSPEFMGYQGVLEELLRSTKYGIQVIATATKDNDMGSKIRTNFLNVITLNMPEKTDYRVALGPGVTFLPSPYKGRGLCLNGGRALEYHTALPVTGANELERNKNLLDVIDKLSAKYASYDRARAVPVVPKDEVYVDMYTKFASSPTLLPIGYNTLNIAPVFLDLNKTFCLMISDNVPDQLYSAACIRNILFAAMEQQHKVYYMQFKRNVRIQGVTLPNVYKTPEQYQEFLGILNSEFAARIQLVQQWVVEHPGEDYSAHMAEIMPTEHIFVVIDNLLEFFTFCTTSDSNLRQYSKDWTENMVSFYDAGAAYGIHFIGGGTNGDFDGLSRGSIGNLYKNFVAYKNGIHFGGNYANVTSFESPNPDFKTKLTNKPGNYGNMVENNTDVELFIPLELR